MICSHRQRPHGPARKGFSIVEILVVIAILGILAALSSAAYFKWIDTRRRDNTEQTIKTLHELLKQQMKIVQEQAKTEDIPVAILTNPFIAGDRNKARQAYISVRMAQEFPTTYAEALDPTKSFRVAPYNVPAGVSWVQPKAAYVSALTRGNNISTPKTPNPATPPATVSAETSIVLLLALKQNRKGVSLNIDQLGAAIADTIADQPNPSDLIGALFDDWGTPLTYARISANTVGGSGSGQPLGVITSAGPDTSLSTATDNIVSNQIRLGN
jgi:prepilin-type N-terminal cleavage/methylation domain-containing protein